MSPGSPKPGGPKNSCTSKMSPGGENNRLLKRATVTPEHTATSLGGKIVWFDTTPNMQSGTDRRETGLNGKNPSEISKKPSLEIPRLMFSKILIHRKTPRTGSSVKRHARQGHTRKIPRKPRKTINPWKGSVPSVRGREQETAAHTKTAARRGTTSKGVSRKIPRQTGARLKT